MATNNAINNTVTENNFSVNKSVAGAAVTTTVQHTDNTNTGSNAVLDLVTGGANGGDPYVHMNTGVTEWSFGADNSDSDIIKLTTGASPSAGTELMAVDSTGDYTLTTTTGGSNSFFEYTGSVTDFVEMRCYNSGTNAGSDANMSTTVASSTSGDPQIKWNILNPAVTYSAGISNANSDVWRLTKQNGLDANVVMQFTSAGEITYPLQPAFLAYNSTADTNKTGAGAAVTVEFDSEVFDQNADYDNTTDTFTSPVAGRVYLSSTVVLSNLSTASGGNISLITSNRSYPGGPLGWAAIKDSGNYATAKVDVLCDMDASDTAYIQADISGEAGNTVGFYGAAAPNTYFSGYLAC